MSLSLYLLCKLQTELAKTGIPEELQLHLVLPAHAVLPGQQQLCHAWCSAQRAVSPWPAHMPTACETILGKTVANAKR